MYVYSTIKLPKTLTEIVALEHQNRRFRATRFKNIPGGMPTDPPSTEMRLRRLRDLSENFIPI